MKRSQRRLAWLLAGVAVLAGLAWWQWRSQQARATLLDLDPAAITRIDIAWQGRPARHYVKRDGHWLRAGNPSARVDDAYLNRMAELAATPVLDWRPAKDMHLNKIGLARPPVVITLDGHALAYGTLAAFGPERFVHVGRRVAVVAASYSPRTGPDDSASSASSSQKS